MIYLDHAAATPIRKEVLKEMQPYFSKFFGNPSSAHTLGEESKAAIEEASEDIKKVINAAGNGKIIFTSSGTESINLALLGVARATNKRHIITTKIEHPAVLETCAYLKKHGFKITYLDVDELGQIDLEELEKAVKKKTALISIHYANSEIGVIQNIREISRRKQNALLHVDACQASGLLSLDVKKLGIDLLSLNAGKVYGPKGVGLLYAGYNVDLKPVIYGGSQELGLRAGTENVPSIVGFAKALELAEEEREDTSDKLEKLQDYSLKLLAKQIPNIRLNGHPTERLPNNLNFQIDGVEADNVLNYLSDQKIYASAGSACKSNKQEPSHVLKALGLDDEDAISSIRLSMGKDTTKEEMKEAIGTLSKIVKTLRKL
ncbi:cysteine desulfurase [Candidatus Woesearchaeota archaeon]|jgi:cysteine desulfurase|nr:cysteine desulfurase [Candidatus Woesearchaeota archaeon]MBT4247721.1 cysteine desulfurase [Candidatus Woesearchaeota archaeon]MBT4434445.1 cysteine desulfurase [Candidatus Woesearchaeota archaeon]MBT7332636.1 cysteine desulfurase [Candidatus Woesearchaeota archaeon]